METVVVINDLQIPYQDDKSLFAVARYVLDIKPDMIVWNGDILDFPGLTTKFLRSRTQKGHVMADIDKARRVLMEFHDYSPHTRHIFMEGNHEARLRNYITERAEELEGLVEPGGVLSLPALLGLDWLEYIEPYGEAFIYKSFVFKHGDLASQNSARAELVMEGSSGISGHTHRLQVQAKTDRKGAHAWYSNMCLCHIKGNKMPPGTRTGSNVLRDWQQGFATIFFDKGSFNVYQTVITGHKFVGPNGRSYRG
jgi:hypothetical protein